MGKKIIEAKVLSNLKIKPKYYVIKIKSSYLAKNSFPGQFVNIKIKKRNPEPLLRIPLGIHKIEKSGISLLYKVVGEGTRGMSKIQKGETISVLGPLGKGFYLEEKKEAVIVSGGHGVAPLYALASLAKKQKIKTQFFIGAKNEEHIVCEKEIKNKKIKVHIATDDGSRGIKGNVVDAIKQKVKNNKNIVIYACGPKPMLKAVSAYAKKQKIKAYISLDEYMACGIGACLGCAIKTVDGYKMICKDGPVFDSEMIIWGK